MNLGLPEYVSAACSGRLLAMAMTLLVDLAIYVRQWRRNHESCIHQAWASRSCSFSSLRACRKRCHGCGRFVGFSVLTSVQGGLNMVSRPACTRSLSPTT